MPFDGHVTGVTADAVASVWFSESNHAPQPLPRWAEFLIRVGLRFGEVSSGGRRIGLVSLPCDSAGAALIVLGALRFRLSLPGANELDGHFQRIQRLADQRATDIALRHSVDTGRFFLRGKDSQGVVWVQASTGRGLLRKPILPAFAPSWTFEGEAAVQALYGAEITHVPLYEALVNDAPSIYAPNLRRSDSGVCLAGRVTGEAASRRIAADVRFHYGDSIFDLSQLLTVYGWSRGTVSRTAFFNARTRDLDRSGGSPHLVVADGDQALLRVLAAPPFRHSDIVGVIQRAIERERLEAIAVKMAELGQWYAADVDLLDRLPAPVRGITISVLKRR